MLLLHGFCESSAIFSRLLRGLDPAYQVWTPVLPGHGDQPWDMRLRNIDDVADWLRDLLDAQAVERVVLVGHSLGGYIAAAFADRYPERLSGIALLHSTALSDPPERRRNREKAYEFIAEYGTAAFLRAFVASLFHDPAPEWILELQQITAQTHPVAVAAFIRIMRDRPDRVAALRSLNVPVMYILGEHDPLVPPDRMRDELMRVELALLHRIPDAGHMGMYESPKKVVAAINSLLELCKR